MQKNKKQILVSGMKPTGRLHLGNFFGALKQVIELQDRYDTTFFIADYHALTTVKDAKIFKKNTQNLILDLLGAGIDPKKINLYKQSDVPEVTELTWIFNCITNVSYLKRAHAYKDAQSKGEEINSGTFNYPILMAADILINKANVVPVGEDQRQHIEYTRDIALKFNSTYKKIFMIPEGVIPKSEGTLIGTDGRKMSKSYNNTIPLFAKFSEIKDSVMKIPTDSKGVEESKDPESCSLFKIHALVASKEESDILRKRYIEGGIGYRESKDILSQALNNYLKPFRERRNHYKKNPQEVEKILKKGSKKIKKRASETVQEVRDAIGILKL